jgi:hypothetical protein
MILMSGTRSFVELLGTYAAGALFFSEQGYRV